MRSINHSSRGAKSSASRRGSEISPGELCDGNLEFIVGVKDSQLFKVQTNPSGTEVAETYIERGAKARSCVLYLECPGGVGNPLPTGLKVDCGRLHECCRVSSFFRWGAHQGTLGCSRKEGFPILELPSMPP